MKKPNRGYSGFAFSIMVNGRVNGQVLRTKAQRRGIDYKEAKDEKKAYLIGIKQGNLNEVDS